MDQHRFDDLARNLGGSNSRGAVLKGLLATTVAGIFGAAGGAGALAAKSDCCPSTAPRLCGTQCVDFNTDTNHCGGCDNVCPDGFICKKGGCVCPPDMTLCGNECVDRTSDPKNCHRCGHVCPDGDICQDGKCVASGGCPSGQTDCNGTCADLSSDANNCGTCGNQCQQGQQCVNGTCTTPNCDDGNPCTTDAFNPSTGTCSHTPVLAGTSCPSTCVNGNTVQTCVCDGNGNSMTSQTSCGTYVCSDGACLSTCSGNQDCDALVTLANEPGRAVLVATTGGQACAV